MSTSIYYTHLDGFDTHSGQLQQHAGLLRELGASLKAFLDDLEKSGESDRVLVLVFSEFGRRLGENGSGGTDHGTAAPVFLLGRPVKPGLHGPYPDLTHLDDGDPDPRRSTSAASTPPCSTAGWASPIATSSARPSSRCRCCGDEVAWGGAGNRLVNSGSPQGPGDLDHVRIAAQMPDVRRGDDDVDPLSPSHLVVSLIHRCDRLRLRNVRAWAASRQSASSAGDGAVGWPV